jgi:Xaa-Pro dipeptidase
MGRTGLDGVVIVQNADLFYFTGTLQAGTLYVPAEGAPLYMVRKDARRARQESALEQIVPLAGMRDMPGLLEEHGHPLPRRLGFELDVLPVAFFERYRKTFPGADAVDASDLIRRVRMFKSDWELARLRESARQADAVYRHAREVIREGMTDIELAAELEHTARLSGHPGLIRMRSFNGEMLYAHICSGPDSALPAYLDTPLGGAGPHPSFGQGAGWHRIGAHEPIIVDNDDMVRVQELMRELAAVGTNCAELYERCLGLAHELGYADQFMGIAGAQVSFIGHGLGVEIDEYPLIGRGGKAFELAVGMAFAFEPKAVFAGQGAVGIENTFYLGGQGLEQITFSDEQPVILG